MHGPLNVKKLYMNCENGPGIQFRYSSNFPDEVTEDIFISFIYILQVIYTWF